MSKRKVWLILPVVVMFALICGSLLFFIFALYAIGSYDVEAAALGTLARCLEIEEDGLFPDCGGMHPSPTLDAYNNTTFTPNPCWEALKRSASNTDNQYTGEMFYYNREDGYSGIRGGREVGFDVTFSDGEVFRLWWYQHRLESCQIVTP